MLDDLHNHSQIPWTPEGELEVLTFDLRGETFALEALLVREIIDLLPETIVPGAPTLLGSVINFRGKIIPLADIGLAFALPATDPSRDSRIVVIELTLENEPLFMGLKTDKVHEVTTLLQAANEDPPPIGMRCRPEHVRSLVRRENDVIVLPDLTAIFSAFAGAGGASVHSIY